MGLHQSRPVQSTATVMSGDDPEPDLLPRPRCSPVLFAGDTLCEVMPKLFLASYAVEYHRAPLLKERNITHVLQVVKKGEIEPTHPATFQYHQVHIEDVETADIVALFGECFDFIDRGRQQGAVLVHCMAGVSRSASVVIAYKMLKEQIGFKHSLRAVVYLRPIVFPNAGFRFQLYLYEKAGCSWEKWEGWSKEKYMQLQTEQEFKETIYW